MAMRLRPLILGESRLAMHEMEAPLPRVTGVPRELWTNPRTVRRRTIERPKSAIGFSTTRRQSSSLRFRWARR